MTPALPPAWQQSLVMRAIRREPVPRAPVWLMRQAGRYLPEYRAVRRKLGFLDLCKTPQLCAEVMLSTVQRLGVDAAILFSDLLLLLEPMGLPLAFSATEGPVLGQPLRQAGDVDRLRELDSLEALEFVLEAVRQTRRGLAEELPLLGFAGAPFTLAAYAIEGGASRDYRHTKCLMYGDSGAFSALLARLGRAVVRLLLGQVAAG
ncbi:MAG: uroporphyrinogen decarboxylase family protein, partial [Thermoguttaceae bacterium]